jgi:hypothetical protein
VKTARSWLVPSNSQSQESSDLDRRDDDGLWLSWPCTDPHKANLDRGFVGLVGGPSSLQAIGPESLEHLQKSSQRIRDRASY